VVELVQFLVDGRVIVCLAVCLASLLQRGSLGMRVLPVGLLHRALELLE
jgi:hypothetical protein